MSCVIGGTESLLDIVWEPLFSGGCTSWIKPQQLSLLCENEEHRGLGSVLWLLELFVYHIRLAAVWFWGKKKGEAAENQILHVLFSPETQGNL